ncbi:MAG: hypothetical protein H6642_00520 [Caldilineaceae bacterium]|nr:hypothetical protein [Caldilineaceae bacterium]MCB9136809.1 hypothetical protein [Caldilineaceae bacterium]
MQTKNLEMTVLGLIISVVMAAGLVVLFQTNFTSGVLTDEGRQYLLVDEAGSNQANSADTQDAATEDAGQ